MVGLCSSRWGRNQELLVVWPEMWEGSYTTLRNVLRLGLGGWTEFSKLSKHRGCQRAQPDKSPKNMCKVVNDLIGWRGWIWEIRARDDLEQRIWKRLQIICLLNKGTWILFMIQGMFSKGELGNNARVGWARSRNGWAVWCVHTEMLGNLAELRENDEEQHEGGREDGLTWWMKPLRSTQLPGEQWSGWSWARTLSVSRDLTLFYVILRNYLWLFGMDGVKYRVRKTNLRLLLSETVRERICFHVTWRKLLIFVALTYPTKWSMSTF